MNDAPRPAPNANAPPPEGTPGGPSAIRAAAPELARRAALEKTRSRLLLTAGGFGVLFAAVMIKLAGATVFMPMESNRLGRLAQLPDALGTGAEGETDGPPPAALRHEAPHSRAMIEDRNGQILALSLPTAGLYANPQEMIDPADTAQKLKQTLPQLDLETVKSRLQSNKQFVYLARNITAREQLAVNDLGIPGIYFEPTEQRRYPQGRVAAQVIGGVDVDERGVAGAERFFDQRLRDNPEPLRLSIDVRVQAAMRDELSSAMEEFRAIGACGIVMDVRTGEVLAMVSLPDYDTNKLGEASPEQRFNRAVTGMYEPGSTFKLQTAAMALDSGVGHLWNTYDAAHNIRIGRFTITDFKGKHRVLTLPEVIAYSSNLGAAHIAQSVGAERQRAWLKKLGMFNRIGVELPEEGRPIVQSPGQWKEVTTMTVGFGHGIAVSPLHVVRGTAVLANGGHFLRPTILASETGEPPVDETQVMQPSTSDTLRKLMRLVVTDGYGKSADVPGYFVGGKTGTAEKTSAHGYKKHSNISAFMSVFPMNAPRYAVYFMLDEPKGNASTGGYSTAGQVAAPGAGRVIARIAPMLGLMPQTADETAIQATLAMPLRPARPGAPASQPMANNPASVPVSAGPAPARKPALQHEAYLGPADAR